MRLDKGGDGFAVTLEAEADGQFIGGQLKVGRFLQGHKCSEELAGCRWPIRPVVSARKFGAEPRAVTQPAGAKAVEVSTADLEVMDGLRPVDLSCNELLENAVKKRSGKTFGQLFFSQPEWNRPAAPWSRVFVGLRYAPASSNPRPRGHLTKPKPLSPFERAAVSFCTRPDMIYDCRLTASLLQEEVAGLSGVEEISGGIRG